MKYQMIAFALMATLLTSCSPKKQEITGFITLIGADNVKGKWNECSGENGYNDVSPGKNITFKDQDGKIIGGATWKNLDELGVNLWKKSETDAENIKFNDLIEYADVSCSMYFRTVLNETPDALVIDNGERGENTYTKSDLDKTKWVVLLSLGGK